MNLDALIREFTADKTEQSQTKTASKKPVDSTSREAKLKIALNNAYEKIAEARKEAEGEGASLTDLEKVASEVADIDQRVFFEEANLFGAGVADGFMGRMNEYDAIGFTKVSSVSDVPTHIAQEIANQAINAYLQNNPPASPVMSKEAASYLPPAPPPVFNPRGMLPAELEGYTKTASAIQEIAESVYDLGRQQCRAAIRF